MKLFTKRYSADGQLVHNEVDADCASVWVVYDDPDKMSYSKGILVPKTKFNFGEAKMDEHFTIRSGTLIYKGQPYSNEGENTFTIHKGETIEFETADEEVDYRCDYGK